MSLYIAQMVGTAQLNYAVLLNYYWMVDIALLKAFKSLLKKIG
jgi:hypothetical protein